MRKRILAYVSVFLGVVSAAGVAGASDSAYIKTQRDDVKPISFKQFSGWTELMFRGSNEKADMYKIRETLFSPRLQLSTRGAVYHEKFLSFNLSGLMSLEQRKTWGGDARSDLLSFNDYNASVVFFGQKRGNLTLFAKRNNAWIESPFRASYRVMGSNYGAMLRFRRIPFPFGVTYERSRREESFSGEERIEDRDQLSVGVRNKFQRLDNDASFRYADYTKNIQFQDYKTLNADWNLTLHFKKHSPGSLRSSARYFHQYGTITRRDFSVFENLLFNWTKHLENSMRYQFTEQGTADFQGSADLLQLNRTHRGNVGWRHTLYGSLMTGLQLYGFYEEFLDDTGGVRTRVGEDKRRGIRGDISYRRKTGWGRLYLGYGYDRAHEEQSSEIRSRHVSNEEHILQDGNEPQLEHTLVDTTTIVITDESGFTVYVEGVDYTVVPFGKFVKIFRIPGGNITDGQIILVDYTYSFSPELAFDIKGTSLQFRFDTVKNFSFFYRYNRTEEDFISGIRNGFLEDHKRHLAGLKVNAGNFSMGEEYEVNRYLAARFVSNRLRMDYNSRFSRRTRLSFSASYSLTRYSDVDKTLHVYMVSSRVITVLPAGMNLEGEGWFRIDRGNRSDPSLESDFSGLRVKVTRDLKAMTLVMGAFYRNANDNLVKDERANFYVSLKRTF